MLSQSVSQSVSQSDRISLIALIHYVFGFVNVELSDVTVYSSDRIKYTDVDENNYVGVENMLQNKMGKTKSTTLPKTGNLTKYIENDILIGNIRPYLKKIWLSDRIGGTNGDVLAIRINSSIMIPKYLYYILSSDKFFDYDMQNSKGAKMPRGDKNAIMKYKFTIPSLEKQREVVSILDKFDKICNDLNTGLPAEIEARQKQYEYYRDKLLTFKEV